MATQMREVEEELRAQAEDSDDEEEQGPETSVITPQMREEARERLNQLENLQEHLRLQEALKDSLSFRDQVPQSS